MGLPFGKHTKQMENSKFSWVNQLQMAMSNSYDSLPELFHQENIGRLIFSQFSMLVAYGVHRYELIYTQ